MVGLILSGGFIVAAGDAGGPYLAVVYLCLCLGGQQFTDSAYWAAVAGPGWHVISPEAAASSPPPKSEGDDWSHPLATGRLEAPHIAEP